MAFEIIEEAISRHMGEQPYRITCAECGEPLDTEKNIDGDYDLSITVTPCKCTKAK